MPYACPHRGVAVTPALRAVDPVQLRSTVGSFIVLRFSVHLSDKAAHKKSLGRSFVPRVCSFIVSIFLKLVTVDRGISPATSVSELDVKVSLHPAPRITYKRPVASASLRVTCSPPLGFILTFIHPHPGRIRPIHEASFFNIIYNAEARLHISLITKERWLFASSYYSKTLVGTYFS